jgi:Transposase
LRFLREADAGLPVKDLCRKHGFSEGRYYLAEHVRGMGVSDAKRLKELGEREARVAVLQDADDLAFVEPGLSHGHSFRRAGKSIIPWSG